MFSYLIIPTNFVKYHQENNRHFFIFYCILPNK